MALLTSGNGEIEDETPSKHLLLDISGRLSGREAAIGLQHTPVIGLIAIVKRGKSLCCARRAWVVSLKAWRVVEVASCSGGVKFRRVLAQSFGLA